MHLHSHTRIDRSEKQNMLFNYNYHRPVCNEVKFFTQPICLYDRSLTKVHTWICVSNCYGKESIDIRRHTHTHTDMHRHTRGMKFLPCVFFVM